MRLDTFVWSLILVAFIVMLVFAAMYVPRTPQGRTYTTSYKSGNHDVSVTVSMSACPDVSGTMIKGIDEAVATLSSKGTVDAEEIARCVYYDASIGRNIYAVKVKNLNTTNNTVLTHYIGWGSFVTRD